jgi:hypothetical protein
MWSQIYDPLGNSVLSPLVAAIPTIVLLALIASGKMKIHLAAVVAVILAAAIAIVIYGMPVGLAARAVALGALTGFFPIGWIIVNVIFLYRLQVENGAFAIIQQSIGAITEDRRLQLLLIAFALGAFFEGSSGFGTPVAMTGSILMSLGFSPLAAAGLSLIANTAPVAFGALAAPVTGLQQATQLDYNMLGAMIGRQLALFSFIVPFWLIWAFAGSQFRGLAIRHLELCQPRARLDWCRGDLPLLPARFSVCVAAQDDLDVGGPAQRRSFPFHHAGGKADGDQGKSQPSVAGMAAPDTSLRHPGDVGNAPGEGVSRQYLLTAIRYRRPAQYGAENATGCAHADAGARFLPVFLSLLQRHGHSVHRHHFRVHHGLFAQAHGAGLYRDLRRGEIFPHHDFGDGGAGHANPLRGR